MNPEISLISCFGTYQKIIYIFLFQMITLHIKVALDSNIIMHCFTMTTLMIYKIQLGTYRTGEQMWARPSISFLTCGWMDIQAVIILGKIPSSTQSISKLSWVAFHHIIIIYIYSIWNNYYSYLHPDTWVLV